MNFIVRTKHWHVTKFIIYKNIFVPYLHNCDSTDTKTMNLNQCRRCTQIIKNNMNLYHGLQKDDIKIEIR